MSYYVEYDIFLRDQTRHIKGKNDNFIHNNNW